MMGGGGLTEVHILYPKRSQLQNLSTQKIHYFFSIPPKNPLVLFSQPKKTPLFFFVTQKNPSVFPRPKKNHFWPKFQTQKITPSPLSYKSEWSPWDFKVLKEKRIKHRKSEIYITRVLLTVMIKTAIRIY